MFTFSKQKRSVGPKVGQCWASVNDAGPTLPHLWSSELPSALVISQSRQSLNVPSFPAKSRASAHTRCIESIHTTTRCVRNSHTGDVQPLYSPRGLEKVYLPLHEVEDTPFHFQGDAIRLDRSQGFHKVTLFPWFPLKDPI